MKVLIARPIDSYTIGLLKKEHSVICAFNHPKNKLISFIKDCNVLIFRSGVNITAELMAAANNLKLIIRAGSGTDNIDLDYVRKNHIKLIRVSKPGARSVAELTFTLMLALSRNIIEADKSVRTGKWIKDFLYGNLLYKKTLGIVGLGNIGSLVGEMGLAWGMKVIGCVNNYSAKRIEEFRKKGICLTSFHNTVVLADFLTIHTPLNEATRNLINLHTLKEMKQDSFLINLSRGGVVNEDALYNMLNKGHLKGAALDVHDQEREKSVSSLRELSNVILTPHIGSNTIETQTEIGRLVVRTINAFSKKMK